MRIAIDSTPLTTGHRNRGVGRYTKLLIEALQEYEKDHSYYFFTRGQKLPENIDVVHYPYFDPYFLTLPIIFSRPTVVTVHDLIPLVFTDHFPSGIRGKIKWKVQQWRLSQTARIITDSRASKRDIAVIAGISTELISVVPLAPSRIFRQITDKSLFRSVTTTYKLPKQFILYVGDINWNKNIVGLLKAYQNVRCSRLLGSSVKLVLVGKAFLDETLKETQNINSFINAAGLSEDVIRIGGVSVEDLALIYNLASVYVQPSMYEGFGFPVLEAMASGCPVVSSDASSLSEIIGPAIRIDPLSIDSISKGILKAMVLTRKDRENLIQAQLQWSHQFNWKNTISGTIEVYKKTIE